LEKEIIDRWQEEIVLLRGPEFYWHGKGFFGPSQIILDLCARRQAWERAKDFPFHMPIPSGALAI